MQEVQQELRQCAFMSRYNALDHMMAKSLDPESILFKFLRSEYEVLSKDNLWTPSQRHVDSSKVSASMNLLHNADSNTNMRALCKSLIAVLHANIGGAKPGFGKKTPKSGACHICGKPDHWSPHCLNKYKGKSGTKHAYGKVGSKGKAGVGDVNWKRTCPKHGEPQSKMVNRSEWFGVQNVTAGQSPTGLRVMDPIRTKPRLTLRKAQISSLPRPCGYFRPKILNQLQWLLTSSPRFSSPLPWPCLMSIESRLQDPSRLYQSLDCATPPLH